MHSEMINITYGRGPQREDKIIISTIVILGQTVYIQITSIIRCYAIVQIMYSLWWECLINQCPIVTHILVS